VAGNITEQRDALEHRDALDGEELGAYVHEDRRPDPAGRDRATARATSRTPAPRPRPRTADQPDGAVWSARAGLVTAP
jgi:hypothetical protein